MATDNINNIPDRRQEGETLLRQIQIVQLRLLEIFVFICNKHSLTYWIDFGTLLGAVRHGGFIPWDDDVDVSMPREDFRKFLKLAQSNLPNDVLMQTMETDPLYDIYNVGLKLRDKYSTMIEDPNGKYHQGIYIDVFPFDKTPRSKVLRNLQRSLYKSLITGSYQNVKKKVTDTRYLRRLCLAQIYKLINVTSVENAILSFYKLDRNFFYRPSLASKADDYYFTEDEIFPLTTIPFEGIDFCAPNKTNVYLEKLYGNYMALPTEDKRKPSHLKSADPFVHCDHADVLEWKERQA